jgi:hypothetical protein
VEFIWGVLADERLRGQRANQTLIAMMLRDRDAERNDVVVHAPTSGKITGHLRHKRLAIFAQIAVA